MRTAQNECVGKAIRGTANLEFTRDRPDQDEPGQVLPDSVRIMCCTIFNR